jgi:phage major head subunit gpT-like protein
MNLSITKSRNSLIQRIHVLKRDLSLDDETYRVILHSICGKDSCAAIDDEYLNLIKQQMEGMLDRMRAGSSLKLTNVQEHKKIAKLGYLLGWNWHDIAGFCFKEVKKKSTQSCTAAELGKIINGMIALVNDGLSKGALKLHHQDLMDFLKYTQSQNRQSQNHPIT